jgi:transcriptional regulator with XRE-family HTH domain
MTVDPEQAKRQAEKIASWFGPHLKRLRTKAGLSQAATAKIIGVAQSRIAEYESPEKRYAPSWETVVRVALAFDVSTDVFLREPPDPQGSIRNPD